MQFLALCNASMQALLTPPWLLASMPGIRCSVESRWHPADTTVPSDPGMLPWPTAMRDENRLTNMFTCLERVSKSHSHTGSSCSGGNKRNVTPFPYNILAGTCVSLPSSIQCLRHTLHGRRFSTTARKYSRTHTEPMRTTELSSSNHTSGYDLPCATYHNFKLTTYWPAWPWPPPAAKSHRRTMQHAAAALATQLLWGSEGHRRRRCRGHKGAHKHTYSHIHSTISSYAQVKHALVLVSGHLVMLTRA